MVKFAFRTLALVAALAPLAIVLTGGTAVEAQGGPPLAPLGLISSSVGTRVSLAWTPNPQGPALTAFVLQAGTGPGLSNVAVLQLAPNQTSLAADVAPGTYYVRILSVNAAGASGPSNEVTLIVGGGGCNVPGPPTGLTATPTSGGVTLRWTAPASGGATSYALDVGTGPGLSNLGTFALANSTTLSAPAPAGRYYVRLRAVNSCGSSTPSAEVSFVIGAVTPLVPLPAGTYVGVMSGNQRPGLGRPPISSFQLTLNQPTPAAFSLISARWADNAGCVKTTFIYAGPSNGQVIVDLESLTCNDGDLVLRVASVSGNVVQGTCNGGPSCTFSMVRQ
jgi:hypothetical protein